MRAHLPRRVAAALVASLFAAGLLGPIPIARAAISVPFAAAVTEPIGPSTVHSWGQFSTDSAGIQVVNLVEANLADPTIHMEALLSNGTATGLEPTSTMATNATTEGHRVVAAVNGDFWSGQSAGALAAPNGLQVHLGELLVAPRGGRPTIGVSAGGAAQIASVTERLTLDAGAGVLLPITRMNQARGSEDLVLYTPRFGVATATADGGTEVVLVGIAGPIGPNGSYPATVQSITVGTGNAALAPGTVVLSGAGTGANALGALIPGQSVTLTTMITPGWESVTEAIGGGEWLVQAGQVNVSPPWYAAIQHHARTGVGLTADGRLLLATVDRGPGGYSGGVRLDEFAQLFLGQGALTAINLDGGGSTTMVARRPGDELATLVNRPSDGGERYVSNALALVSTAPTGPLAGIGIRPAPSRLILGTSTAFTAVGWDAAMNGVAIDPTGVAWSASAGTIDATGRFQASAPGAITVQASTLGQVGQLSAEVVADTIAPVAGAPYLSFLPNAQAGQQRIWVRVDWPAATDLGSGVAAYRLWQSTNSGPFVAVPLSAPLVRSTTLQLAPGPAYRFAVDATDSAGNVGANVAGSLVRQLVVQETAGGITYSGPWVRVGGTGYYGGAIRTTYSAKARATFRFTGSDVAWVSALGPTRGSAQVLLDGKLVATIDLFHPTNVGRRVVYRAGWPTLGSHRLEIRPLATRGHPRVDIDAFLLETGPAPDPVLVGAGDIAACGTTGDSATAALIKTIPGTVFTAGDNAYPVGSAADFANCYDPTWGAFKARTQPAPGNHDWVTPGAAGYFGAFGSRVGSSSASWYAYNLGSWRIYALDSNCDQQGGCGSGSPMEAWLLRDLAANPRPCVLAYWHHPRFSSGIHGNATNMQTIWADLQTAGAEIVINGHDHDYERFAPQNAAGGLDLAGGMREFVVGTGGAELRSFATIQPNSQVRRAGVLGVLKLTLRPAGYEWAFIPVAGSSGADNGWGSCH